jgi:addiction module HigA family antidote
LGKIVNGDAMTTTAHHPGEILAHRLEALGVTPTELARQLHVPPNRITQIVNGKRAITGDSALRLAHWFGNDPKFWMALQARYDLEVAKTETGQQIDELPTHLCRNVRPAKRRAKLAQPRAA